MPAKTPRPVTTEDILDKYRRILDVEADRLLLKATQDGLGWKDGLALAEYAKAAAGIYRAEIAVLSKFDLTKLEEKALQLLARHIEEPSSASG